MNKADLAAKNREYYLKNKDRIAKRRKRLYAENPAYRQNVRDCVKRGRERSKAKIPPKRVPWAERPPRTMLLKLPCGAKVESAVYTSGQFARYVGVSKGSIRSWTAQYEVLPEALYFGGGKRRLYTYAQAMGVKAIYAKHKALCGKRWRVTTAFAQDLHALWKRLYYGLDPQVVPEMKDGKEAKYAEDDTEDDTEE